MAEDTEKSHSEKPQDLSIRQRKFIDNLISGDSVPVAGKQAGYSSHQAAYQAKKSPNVQKKINKLLKKMGLDDKSIMRKFAEGANATKITDKGVEVPDWPTRHRFLDSIAKFKSMYPPQETKTDMNVKSETKQVINIIRFSDLPVNRDARIKQIGQEPQQIGMSANQTPEAPPNTIPSKS